jgi:hypothetical protein
MKNLFIILLMLFGITNAFSQAHNYTTKCFLTKGPAIDENDPPCPACVAEREAKRKADDERVNGPGRRAAEEARRKSIEESEKEYKKRQEREEYEKKREANRPILVFPDSKAGNSEDSNAPSNQNNRKTEESKAREREEQNRKAEELKTREREAEERKTQERAEENRRTEERQAREREEQSRKAEERAQERAEENRRTTERQKQEDYRIKSSATDKVNAQSLFEQGVRENDVNKMQQAKKMMERSNKTMYNPATEAAVKRMDTQIATTQAAVAIVNLVDEWNMPFYLHYGQFFKSENPHSSNNFLTQFGFWRGFNKSLNGLKFRFDLSMTINKLPEVKYKRIFKPEGQESYYTTNSTGTIFNFGLMLGPKLEYWVNNKINVHINGGVCFSESDIQYNAPITDGQISPYGQGGILIRFGEYNDSFFKAGVGHYAYKLKVSDKLGSKTNDLLGKAVPYTVEFDKKYTGGLFWYIGIGKSFDL